MFYLTLILPHLLAIIGLLAFALHTAANSADGDADERRDDGGGGSGPPPVAPQPGGPGSGLPLDVALQPRRRLRVGERLEELHPPRPRREQHPPLPRRAPAK